MVEWSNISDPDKLYLGYFPGSGGSRLRRQILGYAWDRNPGRHLHRSHDVPGLTEYTTEDIPKYPEPWYIDWSTIPPTSCVSSAIDLDYKILTGHAMHVPTIKQVFPGRKIVKIYSDLQESLRRWWVVFGKQWYIKNEPPTVTRLHLSQSPMSSLENAIKYHLDYYSRFYDCGHDYAVYIIPGESEFADFMLEDFENIRRHPDALEFDRCWNDIIDDPRWTRLMLNPLLKDPEFCRNKHEYLDVSDNLA